MTAMVTPAEARERARNHLSRRMAAWSAGDDEGAGLDLPLHPPNERQALADLAAARAWVQSWDGIPNVMWGGRSWPSAGRQRVPERLVLRGADAVAEFAGPGDVRLWHVVRARVGRLLGELGGDARDVDPPGVLRAAVRSSARAILDLPESDFDRLVGVLTWLVAHPASGCRIRQLPIRGVDTKWVGHHRGLVTRLYQGATDRPGLGLVESDVRVRLRFLDPELRPAGLGDVTAPVADLAALPVAPESVLVVENLETLLVLPDLPGTVAVFGGGFGAASRLGPIGWLHVPRVRYWGDLDSNGFAILDEFRTAFPGAASLLMDEDTLLTHRDLWVPEPKPARGALARLSPMERGALARLRAEGDVRLEQERIPWPYALDRLRPDTDGVRSHDPAARETP